jgi:transcription initiation factor IIE alpha subunit
MGKHSAPGPQHRDCRTRINTFTGEVECMDYHCPACGERVSFVTTNIHCPACNAPLEQEGKDHGSDTPPVD